MQSSNYHQSSDSFSPLREWITAEEEYIKNPDMNKVMVQELMIWMTTQDLPLVSEQAVIRFYHSCFFDLEKVKKCIRTYFQLRLADKDSHLYFRNRDITQPNLEAQLKVVQFSVFPVEDSEGNTIVFNRLQDFEPSKYVFVDTAKLLGMAIDSCLVKRGTQPGLVVLLDMAGFQFAHLFRYNLSKLRKLFIYVQEALPVRLKAIHVVNTRPLIDKIMFILKPIMRSDLINMIHFHSGNYEEVQKYLPKNCLPSDFGGNLPSASQLHDIFMKEMMEMKEEFLREELYFENQMKKEEAPNGLSSSVSGLEFD